MAGCSKQDKEEFLAFIGKEPTIPQKLEFVLKCRPYAYWNKELKKNVFNIADVVDREYLDKSFEELSDPKTFDYYEDTFKKNFRKKNEKKCSECHGWKLNEEYRFYKTCCRCRASTVEEDTLKQEELRQSQVCSTCHSRKPFSEFNIKKGKVYKTCFNCVKRKNPEITPEPPENVPDTTCPSPRLPAT
jgi:hypothetical protein